MKLSLSFTWKVNVVLCVVTCGKSEDKNIVVNNLKRKSLKILERKIHVMSGVRAVLIEFERNVVAKGKKKWDRVY